MAPAYHYLCRSRRPSCLLQSGKARQGSTHERAPRAHHTCPHDKVGATGDDAVASTARQPPPLPLPDLLEGALERPVAAREGVVTGSVDGVLQVLHAAQVGQDGVGAAEAHTDHAGQDRQVGRAARLAVQDEGLTAAVAGKQGVEEASA